jgi:RNA polymerase sigma-70 factor (ECF subfamily)
MPSHDSFDALMTRLQRGDDEAAAQVFQRFAHQLIRLARSQLDGLIGQKVDPEDVVQSVYRSFFCRHAAGQFDLPNWNGLWGLLTVMTVRKCSEQAEYFRAARRDVRRELSLPDEAQARAAVGLLAREPTPAEAAAMTDLLARWLGGFEGHEQLILTLHLQGYTLLEITGQVGRARRTVQRTIERGRKRLLRLHAGGERA